MISKKENGKKVFRWNIATQSAVNTGSGESILSYSWKDSSTKTENK